MERQEMTEGEGEKREEKTVTRVELVILVVCVIQSSLIKGFKSRK